MEYKSTDFCKELSDLCNKYKLTFNYCKEGIFLMPVEHDVSFFVGEITSASEFSFGDKLLQAYS